MSQDTNNSKTEPDKKPDAIEIKEFMTNLLAQYLEEKDSYWSIEIEHRNGRYFYSIYLEKHFRPYSEEIKKRSD